MNKQEFITALSNGEFDNDLDTITAAVQRRRAATAPQVWDFIEGQEVRLSSKANPKYLRGVKATIRQINRTRIVIDLNEPHGRFHRGISTPVSMLERVN
jgi:hypothetical protein